MGDLANNIEGTIESLADAVEVSKISPTAEHRAEPEAQPCAEQVSPSRQVAAKPVTMQEQFRAFAKFGDSKSDGRTITLSQSDKWMKQANVIDGKKITTTDTGIHFKKFKLQRIPFTDYLKFLDELAKSKKVDSDDIKAKLMNCGTPGLAGTTAAVKSSTVNRLTNSAQYTGSHKQRFDSAGKGKGTEGRKDIPDGTGYVTGFKGKEK